MESDEIDTKHLSEQQTAESIQSSIIRSIASVGLKAAIDLERSDEQFVASKDEEINDYIDGVVIDSSRDIDDQLFEGLYGEGLAVFTVLAERNGERSPRAIPMELEQSRRSDYEKRMQSSCLVITTNPAHQGARMVPADEINLFVYPREIYSIHKSFIDTLVSPEKLKIVDNIKRRVRGVFWQQFDVPDYEKCIKEFKATGKFFISAIRLPTSQDVNRKTP